MSDQRNVVMAVHTALTSEPRLELRKNPIAIAYDGEALTLEGEAPSVAAKKLALEQAAAVPEVTGIVDRLHVKPAQRMGDGEIRDLMRNALLQEPALSECAIYEIVKGERETVRETPASIRGAIELEVRDGIITLNGAVGGLDEKRLAGVLAWWIPGTRDVVNGLAVEPDEEDSFDLIAEAVRLTLEKDAWVDASQLRVGVRGRTVTLGGILPSDAQRDMAERDTWYIFGVDKVVNNIEVGR
jgi:osmotically-inducible protein OsmY